MEDGSFAVALYNSAATAQRITWRFDDLPSGAQAARRLRLRDLVLVVGELEVGTLRDRRPPHRSARRRAGSRRAFGGVLEALLAPRAAERAVFVEDSLLADHLHAALDDGVVQLLLRDSILFSS